MPLDGRSYPIHTRGRPATLLGMEAAEWRGLLVGLFGVFGAVLAIAAVLFGLV
ncbi:MAG: hypothetical protein JWR10_3300 [Rubritepida sp.]|nr:hypothetical protein [Rubritepida sp.]